MNDFQKEALNRLEVFSVALGLSIAVDNMGDASKFVELNIGDFKVWIYPEGDADFKSAYLDRRFERFDFKDQAELLDALVASLRDGVENQEKYKKNPEKDSPAVLNSIFEKLKLLVGIKTGRKGTK